MSDDATLQFVTQEQYQTGIDSCKESIRQEIRAEVAELNVTIAEKISDSDVKRAEQISEIKGLLTEAETKLFKWLVGIAVTSVLALLTLYFTVEFHQKDSVKSGFDMGAAVEKADSELERRIDKIARAVESLIVHDTPPITLPRMPIPRQKAIQNEPPQSP